MNQKLYILIIIVVTAMCATSAQDSRVIPPQEIPAQNLLKFNRYLMNPTFTRVGLKNSYISLYTRNQWVQFDDAPTNYLINYSSRVNQNVGVGLSLQQQSTGVLNYLGINANYAYGIQMSEKTWLTFGTNLSFFDSGLRASALTADSDPLLANFDETTLLSLRPGLNLTMGRFDLGVYAENLLSYDLGQNELSEQSQIFSGHLTYRQPLAEDNSIQIMTRVRRNENEDTILSGNLLLDIPSLGWAQVGYNDFFGGSIGLGINISDRISLGYVLEQGLSSTTESLGVTHELTVAYRFRDISNNATLLEDLDASLDNFVENSTAKNMGEQEIKKLKEEIEANAILIEDLQYRQDSIQQASRATSENQLKQMIAMQKVQEHMNTPALKKLTQPAARISTPTTYKQTSPKKVIEPAARYEVKKEITTANNSRPSRNATINKVITASHPSGYYLIGNIFKNKRYAQRFYNKLQKEGFKSSANLENVKNNLNYVAIERFNSLDEATAAYSSQINGRYTDPISILEIKDTPSIATASLQPEIVEDRDLSTIKNVGKDIAFAKAKKPNTLTTNKSIEEKSQNALTFIKGDSINSQNEPKENTRTDYGLIKTGGTFQKIFSTFDNETSLNNATTELRSTGITGVSRYYKKDINQWYLAYGNFETEESAMNDSIIVDKSSNGNTAVIEVGQLINLTSPLTVEKTPDRVTEVLKLTPPKKATPTKPVISQNTVVSTVPKTVTKPLIEKDVKTVMKSADLNNLEPGYYIIANVYAKNYWYKRFITTLEKQNLSPKTFINPKNNYKYVYLKREDTYQDAIDSYKSNLNSTYTDDIWILKIE